METDDFNFLQIMESNFSEAERACFAELTHEPTEFVQEEDPDKQDRAERIYHASQDPGIADCLLFGDVEIDELLARLQTDYDLTEKEARELIDDVGYQTREIVDYGDEA